MSEKSMTIRMSGELHKEIKRITTEKEITIKDYVTALIEKDVKKQKSDQAE